jgi:hypothetical protein
MVLEAPDPDAVVEADGPEVWTVGGELIGGEPTSLSPSAS